MGAGNVSLAFARWGSLNHAPFRALVFMAHRSLDSGNPPQFWGGREELAVALGRPLPEPYGDEFEKKRKADFEMVKKVVAQLTSAGAVTLAKPAGPRQNAVYSLNLRSGGGGKPVPPSGGNSVPRMVGTERDNGGKPVPPLGEEGEVGVLEDIDGGDDQLRAGSARARVSGKKSHQFGAFNYRSASEFLMTLDDARRAAVCAQAETELGNGDRTKVIIHAAQLARGVSA